MVRVVVASVTDVPGRIVSTVGEAIRAAARRESPLNPRVARTILDAKPVSGPLGRLSPREHQVLVLLVEGLSNKLSARRLMISGKTVKAHLTDFPGTPGDRPHAGRVVGCSQRHPKRPECRRHT